MSSNTYASRASSFSNPVAVALLRLMEEKQTNLCVSADLTSADAILKLANDVGPYICMLKTHADIISDFSDKFIVELRQIADRQRFVLFEDRKFADIGNTVQLQYSAGVHKIASWSDMVNAHTLPGEGIITGLKAVGLPLNRGLLLLAQMSTKGTLFTKEYTAQTVQWAVKHADFVVGFIAQERLTDDRDFLYLTPGVGLDEKGDSMGQQYRSPEEVILHDRCDVIIVGRGIYKEGRDPAQEAKRYRDAGWAAYSKRISSA
ncbi:orotidine 5'-phosphate decarboxylase [Sorochytrium milnesiophthora]